MDTDVGVPGTITVVDPSIAAGGDGHSEGGAPRSRKRGRSDMAQAPDGITDHEMADPEHRVQEQYIRGDGPEEEQVDPRSEVQRLLDAKHRRRRLDKHKSHEQVQEDMEDVKRFLSLSAADKEAYLAIYEYDGTNDMLAEGMAKASALALRAGLAYTVDPKNYDIVTIALDMPEVKDGLTTMWDCVDIGEYGDMKAVKMAAAAGQIGDTLLGVAMKLYQSVNKAADIRAMREEIERRKARGDQSSFDFSVSKDPHGSEPVQSTPTPGAVANI